MFSIQDEVISKIIRHEQHNLWHVLQGKAIDTYLRKHRMHREVLLAQMEEERIRAMQVNSNGFPPPSPLAGLLNEANSLLVAHCRPT